MIQKIKRGLMSDDLVKDRETLLVHLQSGDCLTCKLYGDGRIVSFSGSMPDDVSYIEKEMDEETAKEIKSRL